jgi:hypothetical protein
MNAFEIIPLLETMFSILTNVSPNFHVLIQLLSPTSFDKFGRPILYLKKGTKAHDFEMNVRLLVLMLEQAIKVMPEGKNTKHIEREGVEHANQHNKTTTLHSNDTNLFRLWFSGPLLTHIICRLRFR